MALDQDAQLLRAVPLLSNFEAEALRILVFSADRRVFPAGATLFRKGERSDGGHLLLSGTVTLDAGDGAPAERFGAGALVGETALFTETLRPATATMAEKGETLRISRVLMRRVLNEYPDTARVVRRVLGERLAAARDTLTAIERRLAES
jgi:CRP-like cAMP-binding protein